MTPPSVRLRPVTEADAGMLLALRNDEAVRSASRSRDPVTEDEHAEWMRGALSDSDRELLIVELDGEPHGQVRFDRLAEGRYEISVSLGPAARGRGLGSCVIGEGLRWLRQRGVAGVVLAEVRADNERSRRAFVSAGFIERAEAAREGFLTLEASIG